MVDGNPIDDDVGPVEGVGTGAGAGGGCDSDGPGNGGIVSVGPGRVFGGMPITGPGNVGPGNDGAGGGGGGATVAARLENLV